MSKTSNRADRVPPSPIRKLVPFAEAALASGKKIYRINIGQPDIETPKEYWSAIHEYPSRVLAYGNARGVPKYVAHLSEYYQRAGIDADPGDIIVTIGGSEAILFAMMAVCDPGDEIIVFEPFYPNYNGYAAEASVILSPVTTDPSNGYHLPPIEEIENSINNRTRAILICSPNNPTGTVLTKNELEKIAAIAEKHDLFVISDEVYREFVYEGKHTSIMHLRGIANRAILLDSISKRFSMCGARLGCVVTKNREINDAIWRMAQARLCPPTIEQVGALAVLRELPDDYFKIMRDEYNLRRDIAYEEIEKIEGTFCRKPAGAFYMMVRFPIEDIEDFSRWMLTDFQLDGETTMIAPGPGFYASKNRGIDEARLAYVLRENDLKKAIYILGEGVKAYTRNF